MSRKPTEQEIKDLLTPYYAAGRQIFRKPRVSIGEEGLVAGTNLGFRVCEIDENMDTAQAGLLAEILNAGNIALLQRQAAQGSNPAPEIVEAALDAAGPDAYES